MAKPFWQVADEILHANRKANIRSLKREKESYTYWRNKKIFAIERARECKALGLTEYQKTWEHYAADYDKDAKRSKEYIRQLGGYIYN